MLLLLLTAWTTRLSGQTLAGSSVPDAAGPALISPSGVGKDYFVLNQDLSVTGRFNAQTTSTITCAAPAGFSSASSTQRTLINDGDSAYFTAQSASANAAASTASPGYPCRSAAHLQFAGGTPAQTFTSNDPQHGRYYVLESFNGSGADTLTVVNNLNTNNSSTPSLTRQSSVSVDTGAVYTAMLTDTTSDYGNTVITERRTDTSPGGLFVYSPGIQTVFRILGPGGTPLPAIGAFFMPAPANDNGQWLVLVNQDGLTSSNLASPPAVTSPFTIIDLGQLQRAFSAVVSQGTTITLPKVVQVPATQSYFAVQGAVYSPVFHVAYTLVASGTSSNSVTQSILRYDLTTPSAPAETVVADVSNVPLTFGTYPQLALNAASGTLAILSQGSAYNVVVAGRNNTAAQLTGSTFGDANFTPVYLASNPLLGETYIASASAVDILGITGSTLKRGTLELFGRDNAVANQSYTLYAHGVNPDYDNDLTFANVTFTATPDGGSPITLGTGQFYQFTGNGNTNTSVTFPAAGIYTVVATVPATANYPAIISLPIRVGVGATRGAPVYPTTTRLVVPATTSSTTVTAQLTLEGSTYAPSGRIVVSDSSGTEVGRYTFTGGATSYPVTATLTLPTGSSTLTATYNGDSQNQGSTSPAVSVNVGGSKVTPALALTMPSGGTAGATLRGNIAFNTTSTTAPTGSIVITAVANGGGTPILLATVSAAAAYAASASYGIGFDFTAPAAGTYTASANYAGDTNYDAAPPSSPTLVIGAAAKIATNTNVSAVATVARNVAFPLTVTFAPRAQGTAAPTGNITITTKDGLGTVEAYTIPASSAQASGGYQKQLQFYFAGNVSITAAYAGDSNYASSTGTVFVNVIAYTGTVTVTGPATFTAGLPATVNVKFVPATTTQPTPGSDLPLLVVLSDANGTPVGQVYAAASDYLSAAGANVSITPDLTGSAISGIPTGVAGNATLVASLGGGPTQYAGVSAKTSTTIMLNKPTLALTGPSSGTLGTAYSATVRLGSAPANTTGTITINVSGVGSSFTVTSTAGAALNGVTLPVSFSLAGTYTLTGTYDGDSNDAGATSSPLTVVVGTPSGTAPTFVLTAVDPSISDRSGAVPVLILGGTVHLGMTVTGYNGYASPVSLSFAKVSGDNLLFGNFTNNATGTVVTSITPAAAGSGITLNINPVKSLLPQSRTGVLAGSLGFAGSLLLLGLSGLRNRCAGKLRGLKLLLLPLLLLSTLTLVSGCGTDYNYGEYVVTATPAAGAADQTVRTVTVWLKTQRD